MQELHALAILLIIYTIATVEVLEYVYKASDTVIDEFFHLPIGLRYCNLNFSMWDNKITTLPGLYIFSTALAAPFNLCTVFALRCTVYVASLLHMIIIYFVIKAFAPEKHEQVLSTRLLHTVNIVTTPPIFFFSSVYYTDILSALIVNAMILCGLRGWPFISSIFGFLAMITRQNNVLYVLFIAGYRILGQLHQIVVGKEAKREINQWEWSYLKQRIKECRKRGIFQHDYSQIYLEGFCYLQAIVAIVLFIYLNGSIVVGDKEAHSVGIHIPQLFYFSLFVLFFAWTHCLKHIRSFCEVISRQAIKSSLSMAVVSLIVKYNTIIHPYMLADNRHYLFYVWHRFLRTDLMRLAMSPIYMFAMYAVVKLAHRKGDLRFILTFSPVTAFILCTQNLIDLRYFITPYILLRMYMASNCCSRKLLLAEFAFNITLIAVTLQIFATKQIYWDDIDKVQRLIW